MTYLRRNITVIIKMYVKVCRHFHKISVHIYQNVLLRVNFYYLDIHIKLSIIDLKSRFYKLRKNYFLINRANI